MWESYEIITDEVSKLCSIKKLFYCFSKEAIKKHTIKVKSLIPLAAAPWVVVSDCWVGPVEGLGIEVVVVGTEADEDVDGFVWVVV